MKLTAQQIWQGFHWSFFLDVQGLIICLCRFEAMLVGGDLLTARLELETATDLMLASGAAMELAGSFTQQEYEHQVRPAMAPPSVQSDNFSGLMCWEHAALMQLWRRLSPVFAALPAELQPQHDRFVAAYSTLASSHKAVCQKFGGEEAGSLRFEKGKATNTLSQFEQLRRQLIDPNRSANIDAAIPHPNPDAEIDRSSKDSP